MSRADRRHTTVSVNETDGVLDVVLDRPERRNALNPAMFAELAEVVASVGESTAVRAVVLSGRGGHFCAGADLREGFERSSRTSPLAVARPPDPFTALRRCPVPTFAGVDGAAIGIGLSLALACDVVVVGAGARLALTQVRLGLVPDGGVSWILPRLVGAQRAAWLQLSGEPIDGSEAVRRGVALEATADGSAGERARQLAAAVAGGASRAAIERVVTVVRTGLEASREDASAAERTGLRNAYRDPAFAVMLARVQRPSPP